MTGDGDTGSNARAPHFLLEILATRQSDPKHVRWQIAASQTLLAMTTVCFQST
jgi:hypothetical protein